MDLKEWAAWESASFDYLAHARARNRIECVDLTGLTEMGVFAVAPILECIQCTPSEIYLCLPTILGVNPAKDASSLEDACKAWVDWGKAVGYLKDQNGQLHYPTNT